MHFRETDKRIQALASVYDPAKKGPRQVLAWSVSVTEAAAGINVRPKAAELLSGTDEQREKWAEEIGTFMEERSRSMRSHAVIGSMSVIEAMVNMLLQDATSAKPTLSQSDIQRLRTLVHSWSVRLHPRVERIEPVSRPKATPGEDPRAFDKEMVEIAKGYREKGLSIAKTAEVMTEQGNPVSKSWVQKWTS